MKHIARLILAALALAFTSCANPSATSLPKPPQVLVDDAVNVGVAAAIGYLQAGKAGAVAAATSQAVSNLQKLQNPQLTSAKASLNVNP